MRNVSASSAKEPIKNKLIQRVRMMSTSSADEEHLNRCTSAAEAAAVVAVVDSCRSSCTAAALWKG